MDPERVLQALRSKQAHIEEQYGLRIVGIIGSVARGEATAESDIDVWVDIIRTPSLFEISRAERDVGEALGGAPIEFVFREDLRPSMRARMERDFVPI